MRWSTKEVDTWRKICDQQILGIRPSWLVGIWAQLEPRERSLTCRLVARSWRPWPPSWITTTVDHHWLITPWWLWWLLTIELFIELYNHHWLMVTIGHWLMPMEVSLATVGNPMRHWWLHEKPSSTVRKQDHSCDEAMDDRFISKRASLINSRLDLINYDESDDLIFQCMVDSLISRLVMTNHELLSNSHY